MCYDTVYELMKLTPSFLFLLLSRYHQLLPVPFPSATTILSSPNTAYTIPALRLEILPPIGQNG